MRMNNKIKKLSTILLASAILASPIYQTGCGEAERECPKIEVEVCAPCEPEVTITDDTRDEDTRQTGDTDVIIPTETPERYTGVIYGSWTAGDLPYTTAWKAQDYTDSQGITKTDINTNNPLNGTGSLELKLQVEGRHENYSKGEAFLDLRWNHSYEGLEKLEMKTGEDGKPIGVDLSGKTIEANVFCPEGTGGWSSAPNGIQMLMKSVTIDEAGNEIWSSYYSNWQNIWIGERYGPADTLLGNVIEEEWSKISFDLPNSKEEMTTPTYGFMDPGFDPSQIALIGIKYAVNDNSLDIINSSIFVDDLGWKDSENSPEFNGVFTFEQTQNPIEAIKDSGFNCASIFTTDYMADAGSTEIYKHPQKSNSKANIEKTIDEMKAQGLNVILKPHIDTENDIWRGLIDFDNEADKVKFFNNYIDWIVDYAEIAQEKGVDMLVIGTEYKQLVDQEERPYWEAVIKNVKNVYSGKLTYASNWDNYQNVCFWDLLDFVGIDAYFPLSDERDPNLNELVGGWSSMMYKDAGESVARERNWMQELEDFQEEIDKPIIFTEIGFRSTDYAAREPWEYIEQRPPNEGLQADCYRSVDVAFKDKEWFKGMFFWNWLPRSDPGGKFDTDFTPQNKEAQYVFQER